MAYGMQAGANRVAPPTVPQGMAQTGAAMGQGAAGAGQGGQGAMAKQPRPTAASMFNSQAGQDRRTALQARAARRNPQAFAPGQAQQAQIAGSQLNAANALPSTGQYQQAAMADQGRQRLLRPGNAVSGADVVQAQQATPVQEARPQWTNTATGNVSGPAQISKNPTPPPANSGNPLPYETYYGGPRGGQSFGGPAPTPGEAGKWPAPTPGGAGQLNTQLDALGAGSPSNLNSQTDSLRSAFSSMAGLGPGATGNSGNSRLRDMRDAALRRGW